MENDTELNQVKTQSDWLARFLKECEHEGATFILIGKRMLRPKARHIVWYICDKLNCHQHGIPGQACRIVEWFLVYTIRNHDLQGFGTRKKLVQHLKPKMLLIVACGIILAAKMNSAKLSLNAVVMKEFLALEGFFYSNDEVFGMECNVLNSLIYRVPMLTSVDMGKELAQMLAVEPCVIPAVAKLVDQAELYRYDIEMALQSTASSRGMKKYCEPRLRSLHLAAGCVTAAIASDSTPNGEVQQLEAMLQLSAEYIECIRDVILVETAKVRPPDDKPLAVLRRKRKNTDESNNRPDSSKPGTS